MILNFGFDRGSVEEALRHGWRISLAQVVFQTAMKLGGSGKNRVMSPQPRNRYRVPVTLGVSVTLRTAAIAICSIMRNP